MPKPRLNLETVAVAFLIFAVLSIFATHGAYEGDDINAVVPLLHLPDAINGDLLIYRYGWQPLSYWAGYATWSLTGSISAIFTLAQLGMAIGLALLYRAVRGYLEFSPLLFVPLLLLFPELVHTGLYFNSSALGFPFAALAVLLAFENRRLAGSVLSGAALGIAVLMRLDYVLIAPAIALFRLFYTRSARDFIFMALSGFMVLGLGLLSGLLNIQEVVDVYQVARAEIIAKADSPGWDNRTKILVTTVILSPVGWLFVAFAGVWILRHPKSWGPVLIGLVCLAPTLLAARNILTPKYMIPTYALMPVLAAMLWQQADLGRWWARTWITATALLLVFSVGPRPPFLNLSFSEPYQIGTHDGSRSWGGYILQWSRVNDPSLRHDKADALAFYLLNGSARPDIHFIGNQNYFSPGGLAWRLVQLRLEKEGYKGVYQGDGQILFDLPGGAVILAQQPPDTPGACIILLTDRLDDPVAQVKQTCGQP